MRLKQVLNNNSLLVDEDGVESVLIGRGIAFGLSRRMIGKHIAIPEERIEKRFVLEHGDAMRFAKLIRDIPYEYVLAGSEVVQFIRQSCTHDVSKSIYLTLIDHISVMAERIERGVGFDTALLGNIGALYREEYSLGVRAVDMLRQRLHLNIDDSEANYIALHIVNAEMDLDMTQVYEVTSVVKRIVNTVEKRFTIERGNQAYERFLVHCRFFAQRVVRGDEGTDEQKTIPYQALAEHYPEQSACVGDIVERIESRFTCTVTEEEKLYLLMHLIRLTDHQGALE